MIDLQKELLNHTYREMDILFTDLFPQVYLERVRQEFSSLKHVNPHQTVFNVARELWNGGYEKVLQENGFWDAHYAQFGGHCHQCTPALGLVLKCLGFETISYLECYRIREHFFETGTIEQVPPEEEPNPAMKEEFCSMGRIPYCCLEVEIEGDYYYMTGKHLKPSGERTEALLSPECYLPFVGVFAHPLDQSKSGIYLEPVIPKNNPQGIDFYEQVVWKKQTKNDPAPELFATFLRMKL